MMYDIFAWTWNLIGWQEMLWRCFIGLMAGLLILGVIFYLGWADDDDKWWMVILKLFICCGSPFVLIFIVGLIGYALS